MFTSFFKKEYHPSPLLKTVQITLFVLIGIGLVLIATEKLWVPKLVAYIMSREQSPAVQSSMTHPTPTISDYRDATYQINGRSVTLKNGLSEIQIAPNTSSKLVTRYFGNAAEGDINSDGQPDIVFLVTQSGSGSGTFFYAVAALNVGTGYQGTNAVLLGDRIAPQTTVIDNGKIVVNYADRAPGEPMTTAPSVGVSKYLVFSGGVLHEEK